MLDAEARTHTTLAGVIWEYREFCFDPATWLSGLRFPGRERRCQETVDARKSCRTVVCDGLLPLCFAPRPAEGGTAAGTDQSLHGGSEGPVGWRGVGATTTPGAPGGSTGGQPPRPDPCRSHPRLRHLSAGPHGHLRQHRAASATRDDQPAAKATTPCGDRGSQEHDVERDGYVDQSGDQGGRGARQKESGTPAPPESLPHPPALPLTSPIGTCSRSAAVFWTGPEGSIIGPLTLSFAATRPTEPRRRRPRRRLVGRAGRNLPVRSNTPCAVAPATVGSSHRARYGEVSAGQASPSTAELSASPRSSARPHRSRLFALTCFPPEVLKSNDWPLRLSPPRQRTMMALAFSSSVCPPRAEYPACVPPALGCRFSPWRATTVSD